MEHWLFLLQFGLWIILILSLAWNFSLIFAKWDMHRTEKKLIKNGREKESIHVLELYNGPRVGNFIIGFFVFEIVVTCVIMDLIESGVI